MIENTKAATIITLVIPFFAGSPAAFLFQSNKKLNTTNGSAKTLKTWVIICPFMGLNPKIGMLNASILAIPVINLKRLVSTSS